MESPNIAGRKNKAWKIHRADSTELLVLLEATELPMTLAFWNTGLSLEISKSFLRGKIFKVQRVVSEPVHFILKVLAQTISFLVGRWSPSYRYIL